MINNFWHCSVLITQTCLVIYTWIDPAMLSKLANDKCSRLYLYFVTIKYFPTVIDYFELNINSSVVTTVNKVMANYVNIDLYMSDYIPRFKTLQHQLLNDFTELEISLK